MFEPVRRWVRSRWLLIAVVLYLAVRAGISWSAWRARETTVSRLEEKSYRVYRIDTIDEWLLEELPEPDVEARPLGRARIRLLAAVPPQRLAANSRLAASSRLATHSQLETGTSQPLSTAEALRAERFVRQQWLGRTVRLELGYRQRDDDGTLLARVYAGDEMVQEVLVGRGWLLADLRPGDNASFARRLTRAQQAAREAGRGVWAE